MTSARQSPRRFRGCGFESSVHYFFIVLVVLWVWRHYLRTSIFEAVSRVGPQLCNLLAPQLHGARESLLLFRAPGLRWGLECVSAGTEMELFV